MRTCTQTDDELFIAEKYSTATSESVGIARSRPETGASASGMCVNAADSPSPDGLLGGADEDEWTAGPTMTQGPLSFCAAAAFDGSMFVFGGYDGERLLSSVLSLNTRKGTAWQHYPGLDLRQARAHSGAAFLQSTGRFYLAGGCQATLRDSSASVLSIDARAANDASAGPRLGGRGWKAEPSMREARSRHALVAAGGCVACEHACMNVCNM
jgi:hypothetical protein